MEQARVVVIGGGITGVSVAYHLAEAGWTDVLLVEKAGLTAGATSQAAGLVTAFNPSSTMLAWRRYSIELYRRLGAFSAVGSVRLASSPEQLKELERTASRARGVGLDAPQSAVGGACLRAPARAAKLDVQADRELLAGEPPELGSREVVLLVGAAKADASKEEPTTGGAIGARLRGGDGDGGIAAEGAGGEGYDAHANLCERATVSAWVT